MATTISILFFNFHQLVIPGSVPDFVQNRREHLRLLPAVVVQGFSLPQNAPPVGGTRARHGDQLFVQVQVSGVRRINIFYAGEENC